MDLMLLAVIAVIIGGTVALCVWAAKVGKKNREKRRVPGNDKFVELTRALGGMPGDIIEVKFLGSGFTKQSRGGLGGAALGGLVAGPMGAVVGAAIPKNDRKQKYRFAVKYSDGSVNVREVYYGSAEYKKLIQYVKWDEIR